MRPSRLVSLIAISLVIILPCTILLAQSSSIADSVIKAPLAKGSAAVKSLAQPDPENQEKIQESYGKLPLSFEANQGQADSRVRFLTRTGAYSMFLTGDEAVLVLRQGKAKNKDRDKDKFPVDTRLATSPAKANSAPTPEGANESILRMKLRNANANARVTGKDELAGTSNYFIGNDPAKWRANVPTYSKVRYEAIYSGIDLVFYGNQRQLEYDFIVAPGVDPHRIAFDISGAKRVRKDEHGDLVFKTGEGEIRWHKPVAYQEKDGARQLVAAHYVITEKNRVGFELAKYDVGRPLYIDPLIYSTYLGGSETAGGNSGGDSGNGIAVDGAGNAYVVGTTYSADFPVTPSVFQTVCVGSCAFVTKLNSAGTALIYSTYLGGTRNYGASGSGIAVDSAGNAYVTGVTWSADFPTMNPLQPALNGPADAFVSKISPTGSALVYSTFLGGSDIDGYVGGGIAVDSADNAYVTGVTWSADFPTTPGAFQTVCGGCRFGFPQHGDAFVSKINSKGSALVYSSYLGGDMNYGAISYGIAVDSAGNAYVTGETDSPDFPITPGAFQTVCAGGGSGGCDDAFVSKINPAGSALVYSTYLGGSGVDQGAGIAVDGTGNAYVTGGGSADFPVTPGAFQTVCAGGCAFVTKLNQAGSALTYSTYLGGNGDHGQGIALDGAGNVYVTGAVFSFNFPMKHPLQPTKEGSGSNGFVAKLNPSGSDLVYSTYLGGSSEFGGISDQGNGIAVDSSARAYVTGVAGTFDFPTVNPLQPTRAGGRSDAFVAKITRNPSDVTLFPLHLDYGHQPIGIGSSPQVSSLINASNATLAVTSINIAGTNSGDFAQTNNCGTSVPAGQSCSISVTFTPTAKGTRIATVSITDGAPDSPEPFSLSGVGTFDTATTLISSVNPSGLGKPVTFTATVSSPSGGTPTGTILFRDGGRELAAVNLFGTTTFRTSKLSLGLHVMTASYQGNSDFGPSSSAPVNQYVLPATNTSLTSSLNPSTYGQPVILTAVVTASNGPPPDGEPVTFLDGNKVVGTRTLHNGSATFSTSALRVGTNYMTALYGGDANLGGSRSAVVKQVVSKATTTTTLTSSQNPSNFGQSVTFTATVKPQFSGTVTGTVTFYDGTTALKTASLNGGVAKFTTPALTVGSHTITATYNGSTNFDGSSASLTQKVN